MNHLLRKGGLALSVLTLGSGAAAGLASGASASARPAASTSAASDPTNTPAAALYAALDQLLREHVDLTATVVQTAVATGASSADTKAAEAALGQNTDALGAAIGSVYGKAAQAKFLALWRAHIGFFVNYTLGKATHNAAMVTTAQRDLAGYVTSFATFMAKATKLPVSALEADLKGHVSTLEAAINAIVAKSPEAGDAISMAAAHMDGTAQVLAKGIVASTKAIKGDVTSAPASLRAALTGLLIQHVAATGFVVETAIAAKGNMKNSEVEGAVHALALNTDQLGAAIGSVYGAPAKAEFLKLWRAHIGFFVNYTLGVATKSTSMVKTAQSDLSGYVTSFSSFVAGATKLPASAVAADLRGHISTLETAINAIVAGKPAAGADLLMAENHMAGTAAVLSSGIVASMPSKFGA
jgi:hypothetical protein